VTEPIGLLEAPLELAGAPAPAAPPTPRPLWIAAALVLVPVVAPLLVLLSRVIGAGSDAWSIAFSARTAELLVKTVALTAAVTAAALVIGTATAWLTVQSDLRGRRMWSVLVSLPLVIPSYVLALVLLSAFGRDGVVTAVLGVLGVDELPSIAGAFGAWLALTISTYPFVHLIASAALRRIDPALIDAARGLGASPWRAFRTAVLPQLRPALAAGGLLAALYTLSDFGAVSLMRFDAFTRVIYAQYQGRLDRTPASVLAVILILVVVAILFAEQRTRGAGRAFTPRPSRVAGKVTMRPAMRGLGIGFLGTVTVMGLLLPLMVLVGWLVRARTLSLAWSSAIGSFSVSLAAAVLASVAAVPVAVLVVRHRSKLSVILDRTVHSVFALPHIAVALAMVFLASNYLGPLYQGFAVLIITYVALFLPQASGAARGALEQVDPNIEEAARGLGRTAFGTLAAVTVPLIGPGLLAGGALVFLTTMKELPATLLLRPTGFDTLAVDIWSAASEGLFARAAAPALLLIVVSAVPMYLLVTRSYER
jgi:iron(III) transport system permease protein